MKSIEIVTKGICSRCGTNLSGRIDFHGLGSKTSDTDPDMTVVVDPCPKCIGERREEEK